MMKGLERAKRLYQERGFRAGELKGEGKKIIGYVCAFPPVELITAAGLVPYRITGTMEPVTEADAYLETLMCPYVRSSLDQALKGRYAFLDGMVWPHTCDNIQKTFDIWKYYVPHTYFHYLDVPHMSDPDSFEFFTKEIGVFRESLEEYAGVKVSDEALIKAIGLHNRNRALLRELSGLRKQEPPLLSGAEMTQVVIAVLTLPVEEANELLVDTIADVKGRGQGSPKRQTRLLIHGCELDDVAFINMVEESGGNVVIDDLCIGTRYYRKDVETAGDPMRNLADHYLGNIMCPRTFRRALGSREEDLKNRFGHIADLAREYSVDGAILYIIRYCDTFEFDAPDVRDYLVQGGIPVLHIEDDYSLTSIQGYRTRVQAFLEMMA